MVESGRLQGRLRLEPTLQASGSDSGSSAHPTHWKWEIK